MRYYYRTIGELQNKIDEYFSKGEILTFRTKNGEETMTVFTDAGLAYYLVSQVKAGYDVLREKSQVDPIARLRLRDL